MIDLLMFLEERKASGCNWTFDMTAHEYLINISYIIVLV